MLERGIKIFLSGVKYGRERRMAMDAGEHWITVNGGSRKDGEGGGSHVKVDGEGRVVAGMGGKYKGTKLEDLPRKHFINETAYQKRQAAATAAGATAASGLYHKGKDGSEFYRYAGSPEGTAWRRKLDDAINDPKYPAEREDYDAARREADQRAQEAQRKAEQAAASAQQSAQQQSPPETVQQSAQAPYSEAAELEGLGLRRWQMGPHDRVYLPRGASLDKTAAAVFGLEVDRYNTGNIRDAKLNGEGISNTKARSLLAGLDGAYFDNNTKQWKGIPEELTPKYPSRANVSPEPAPAASASTPKPGAGPAPAASAPSSGASSGGTAPRAGDQLDPKPLSERQRVDLSPKEMHEAAERIRAEWYSAPLAEGHAYLRRPEAIGKETAKAVFCPNLSGDEFFDGNETSFRNGAWLPKSHCTIKDGQVIGVSPWIAEQKRITPLGYYRNGSGIHPRSEANADADVVFTRRQADSGSGWPPANQPPLGLEARFKEIAAEWVKEDRGETSSNPAPTSAPASATSNQSAPKTRAKITDPISKQKRIDPEANDWIPAEAVPARTIPGEGEFSPATYVKGKSAGEVWYEKDPAAYKAQGQKLQEGLRAMQPALDRLSGLVSHLPAGPRKSALKNMMLAAEGRPGAENAPIQPKSLNSVEGLYRRFANARNALTTAARNADIQTLLDRPVAVQAPEHADPSGVTNIKIDLPPHLSSADLRRIEEFGFRRDPVSGGYRRKVSGGEADYQQVRADIDRMKGQLKYQTGSLMQGEQLPDTPRPAGG